MTNNNQMFKELDESRWYIINESYKDVIRWRTKLGKTLNPLTQERWELIQSLQKAGMRPNALKTFHTKPEHSDMMIFVKIAEEKWGGKDERI